MQQQFSAEPVVFMSIEKTKIARASRAKDQVNRFADLPSRLAVFPIWTSKIREKVVDASI